jgi:hypothetical protein
VVVLTVADIPVVNICCGAIWQSRGWNPQAEAGLLAHLAVWIASAILLCIHVSDDLRRPLRERAALSRDPWPDSSELRRASDV